MSQNLEAKLCISLEYTYNNTGILIKKKSFTLKLLDININKQKF